MPLEPKQMDADIAALLSPPLGRSSSPLSYLMTHLAYVFCTTALPSSLSLSSLPHCLFVHGKINSKHVPLPLWTLSHAGQRHAPAY